MSTIDNQSVWAWTIRQVNSERDSAMTNRRKLALIITAGAGALAAMPLLIQPLLAQQKPVSGPVARYDMRAGTVSGMGAMGGGMGAGLGMMFGRGGNNTQHELLLRLGSSRTPVKGGAKADHFMPPVAKLGKSVALVTPAQERMEEGFPPGQRPRGRMLIYWGCGERAPKGQPVVIDFAKLAAGQIPPGMWSTTIIRDWGPTLQNSRTFGRWPAEDGKYAKPDGSLIGAHRIAGNYSPEIGFTLTKDFMTPLRVTATAQTSGSTLVRWGAIADATGYHATLFGGKRAPDGQMGDMVMWSSSASRQFGGGLSDWLTPAQVGSLVRDRTVMAPATTSCIIPAEVRRDAPDFRFGMLTAFGPLEDFSYPPRPADPKAAWNLEWTARIRHRSTTSWMDMPGMGQMGQMGQGMEMPDQSQEQSTQPKPECKPSRGLGGLLGSVIKPGC